MESWHFLSEFFHCCQWKESICCEFSQVSQIFIAISDIRTFFKICAFVIKMSKVSGLQLVKPRFEWDAPDKLKETEQFKVDCKILFDGPLSDLTDKQCADLIVNWLGRKATQILTSVDVEINSTGEVFNAWKRFLGLNLTKHWPISNLEI